MEPALIINIIMGFVLVLVGWFMRVMWDSIKRLQSDMSELERHASETYVRRDDYRDDMAEVKSMLRQIFEVLNGKQDR
jgi:uncharacterized membrane protein (DUF106 family)